MWPNCGVWFPIYIFIEHLWVPEFRGSPLPASRNAMSLVTTLQRPEASQQPTWSRRISPLLAGAVQCYVDGLRDRCFSATPMLRSLVLLHAWFQPSPTTTVRIQVAMHEAIPCISNALVSDKVWRSVKRFEGPKLVSIQAQHKQWLKHVRSVRQILMLTLKPWIMLMNQEHMSHSWTHCGGDTMSA